MAPIAVGDSIPDGTLEFLDDNNEIQQVSIHSLAKGKKIILFGVPGGFTPTCRSIAPGYPLFFYYRLGFDLIINL